MAFGRTSAAAITATVALALAASPGAGAAIPLHGTFTGTTAAGEPFSMAVGGKTVRSEKRPKPRRLVMVKRVTASVPVTCSIAADHSEEVGFPGPLGVGRKGRFSRTGRSGTFDIETGKFEVVYVTTTVAGRFTAKREASGTLTYRGGFGGEFCTGTTPWTATRG